MESTASEKGVRAPEVATSWRPPVGGLLRAWRRRQRLSQLDVSVSTGISARHLSCIETGRARPSAQMVIRLGEHLGASKRERNDALLAAGHAPAYSEKALGDAALSHVRAALRRVLEQHEPFPALVLDRRWDVVEANRAFGLLLTGVPSELLREPLNALRLTLHPEGLAPRVLNLAQWRAHLLLQLARRLQSTADPHLADLQAELETYPFDEDASCPARPGDLDVVLPLRLRLAEHAVSFFSLSAALTSAGDITLEELTVETFHPSDQATAAVLRRWSRTASPEDTTA